jgi:hypothetical protein
MTGDPDDPASTRVSCGTAAATRPALTVRGNTPASSSAYLNRALPSSRGGEWLCGGVVGRFVPRVPGLIWVLGLVAGDVMVDGSVRGERLRPLGLWWTAARGRESRNLWERAGRLAVIRDRWAWRNGSVWGQLTGSSASGPSSRSVWKQRRASLRAIVNDALVCESPRALSAR